MAAWQTSYGFRTVGEGEKQGLVNDVFHKVARRYDIMNDVMSGGLHRVWKDAMVAALNPPRRAGYRLLDVAGGTGDIAFRIVEASGRKAHAARCSTSTARCSASAPSGPEDAALPANLEFVEANAEELPFADKSFDAYTIAFGIRNVPRHRQGAGEAYRVLRRGGRFLCLEFSEVEMPILDRLYEPGRSTPSRGWAGRHRRRRALPVSRRIDPQVSAPGRFRRDDRARRLRPRQLDAITPAASRRCIPAGSSDRAWQSCRLSAPDAGRLRPCARGRVSASLPAEELPAARARRPTGWPAASPAARREAPSARDRLARAVERLGPS